MASSPPDTTTRPAAGAVFLSYAREDTAAARRIADALRAFGVEVWFDQNELRGGDAWDQKIRTQIKDCALFLPVISANTQDRGEGYFRLEWKLAAERTHLMAEGVPFLAPIVVDETPEGAAAVPPEFMRVQWTRLADGMPTSHFVDQVKRLLAAPRKPTGGKASASAPAPAHSPSSLAPAPAAKSGFPLWAVVALVAVVIGLGAFIALRPSTKETSVVATPAKPAAAPSPLAPRPAPASVNANEKSVAVLAFADLSEARNSEYFSDGISEELLNVLAKVPGLRVAARTSAFSFKGRNLPIPEIAQKLNVAYVVEGSVQRDGERVKITALLIKAADGFHVWSDKFTRDLKDVFAVQEEIAGLIAKQLSLKLGASSTASTAAVNPQAFELYVQGRQAWNLRNPEGYARAEQLLNRALELAPDFARAHSALADVWFFQAQDKGISGTFSQPDPPDYSRIVAKIRHALALDPDSAEARASLGNILRSSWKSAEAEREYRRAIALNPNYASAHQWLGRLLADDGRMDEALSELKFATEIDPLSSRITDNYAYVLYQAGRNSAAIEASDRALAVQPNSLQALAQKALVLVRMGRVEEAVALARQLPPSWWQARGYQIVIFGAAGLTAEAEALLPGWNSKGDWPRTLILLALGRREDAIAALDAASTETSRYFVDPICDPIRHDPRFEKFMATLGRTEANERVKAWRKAHPPEQAAKK